MIIHTELIKCDEQPGHLVHVRAITIANAALAPFGL